MPMPERPLTDEQLRVVELVARGLSDRRIAQELGISESTVQRRLREASRAVGAGSRVELAVRAVSRGLVPPAEEGT